MEKLQKLGREKEGDSCMSVRQGAVDREERWGMAVRLLKVNSYLHAQYMFKKASYLKHKIHD